MRRFLALTTAALFILVSRVIAQDAERPETSIAIYRVGDLISGAAINSSGGGHVLSKRVSPEDWQGEYKETTKALDELQDLVLTLCSEKPVAVSTHRQSLSLLVRHTQDGHEEIKELLKGLRVEESPAIRLECRALFSYEGPNFEAIPADKQERLQLLITKTAIAPDEARELIEIIPDNQTRIRTVLLRAGRRTAWGDAGRPCTVVGRVLQETETIQLRVDYIADDPTDTVPVGTQRFEIKNGHSALFHHHCDGGTVMWLITASIIGTSKQSQTGAASLLGHAKTRKQSLLVEESSYDFRESEKYQELDSATKEKLERVTEDLAVLEKALVGYMADHAGQTPEKLGELVPGYLRSLPKDPFAGTKVDRRRQWGHYERSLAGEGYLYARRPGAITVTSWEKPVKWQSWPDSWEVRSIGLANFPFRYDSPNNPGLIKGRGYWGRMILDVF